MAQQGIRSFVAVLLPEGVRRRIHEAAADLRGRAPALAWVPVENLHLTLRFLGAIEADRLTRVERALDRAAAEWGSFPLSVGGLGAFPRPAAPRVLWVGVTAGEAPVTALQRRVEAATVSAGLAPEERAFHPHVTLGRVRSGERGPDVSGEAPGPWAPLGGFGVEAIHLMGSELGSGPARYRVVGEYRLQGFRGTT